MITGSRERPVQTAEEPARIVRNAGYLAMHRRWRAYNISAKRLSDRLMAKADPEHWRRFTGRANEIDTNARFVRRARPRGEDDGVRLVDNYRSQFLHVIKKVAYMGLLSKIEAMTLLKKTFERTNVH